jgi:hypothetical protein
MTDSLALDKVTPVMAIKNLLEKRMTKVMRVTHQVELGQELDKKVMVMMTLVSRQLINLTKY